MALVFIRTRSSSSTTRIFRRRPWTSAMATRSRARSAAPPWPMAVGSHISAVVPSSGRLATRRRPPDCSARPCTIGSPSPVPLPTPLVVKNGSMAWARVPSSMPMPVSDTDRQA